MTEVQFEQYMDKCIRNEECMIANLSKLSCLDIRWTNRGRTHTEHEDSATERGGFTIYLPQGADESIRIDAGIHKYNLTGKEIVYRFVSEGYIKVLTEVEYMKLKIKYSEFVDAHTKAQITVMQRYLDSL